MLYLNTITEAVNRILIAIDAFIGMQDGGCIDMRKLFMVPMLALAFFFATVSSASAADVWVDYWPSENVQIYVAGCDGGVTKSGGIVFSADIKQVRDGQLVSRKRMNFYKDSGDFWRHKYGTDPRVIVHDKIFEYCATALGIRYSIYTERNLSWYK